MMSLCSHIHTHSDTLVQSFYTHHSYTAGTAIGVNVGLQCLAQGHYGMLTGGARAVSGRPAPWNLSPGPGAAQHAPPYHFFSTLEDIEPD